MESNFLNALLLGGVCLAMVLVMKLISPGQDDNRKKVKKSKSDEGVEKAVAALRPRFRAIHEALRRGASARAAEAVAELVGAQAR